MLIVLSSNPFTDNKVDDNGPHEFQKEPSQSSSSLKKRKRKKPRDLTCVEEPSLNSIAEDQTIEELCSGEDKKILDNIKNSLIKIF